MKSVCASKHKKKENWNINHHHQLQVVRKLEQAETFRGKHFCVAQLEFSMKQWRESADEYERRRSHDG